MIRSHAFAAAGEVLHLLGWSLLHFLWEGTLVALLLGIVLMAVRNRTAQTRYGICCVALALMTLCPIVTFIYLERQASATMYAGQADANTTHAISAEAQQSVSASLLERAEMAADHAMPWMLAVWVAGVMVFLARMIAAGITARRLRSASTVPAPESLLAMAAKTAREFGILRAFEVLGSETVTTPTVIGWLKPVILFPVASFMNLTPEQLEAMLAHELAHVRRHDYLVNALQAAVETLLFYHPAVWWVSRQIRREREHCCDDVAVAATGSALKYARALYLLEEQRANAPVLTLGANGGELKMRIKRLLTGETSAARSGAATWMLTIAMLFLLAGIAVSMVEAHKASAQSPAPPPAPTVTSKDATENDPRLRVLKAEDPAYPAIAKAAHISGDVMVAITVNPKGEVIQAHITHGEPMLQQAALDAVRQYKFAPFAARDDRGAKAIIKVSFVYYGGAQNDAAKTDLSCTYYDGKIVSHAGTCELDENNGRNYLCRRNDGDKQAQVQVGCKEKIDAVKSEQSLAEPRVEFQRAWEARRTGQ